MVLVAGAIILLTQNGRRTTPPIANHVPQLTKRLVELEEDVEQEVATYSPKSKSLIDDPSAPADEILQGRPYVVQVEALVKADQPIHRVIHLRDWHYVPKDLYALDMKGVFERELTADEISQLHRELLLKVELIQLEQMAVLRCLIRHHGLKRVHSEGLSPKELDVYRTKIGVLEAMEQNQIPRIRSN